MDTALFDYPLPNDLIALYPPKKRDGGKLMVLAADGRNHHARITDLPELIPRNALVIANNSKVFKAKLNAHKPTGGKVEILLVRLLADADHTSQWIALCKANKPLVPGQALQLADDHTRFTVEETLADGSKRLCCNKNANHMFTLTAQLGDIPLPPYIRRKTEPLDEERYQTVFANPVGSVAAPTAGLHLTTDLIAKLRKEGRTIHFITLHVGPGTFRPISAGDTRDHRMDEEHFLIDEQTVQLVNDAKNEGRPIFAVGTTTVRALEGCAAIHGGTLAPGPGKTDIFITPPYKFNVVDGLLTNFHLPKSTLICLVSALSDRQRVLAAYREAVQHRYRFYSYGDAMLIMPGRP